MAARYWVGGNANWDAVAGTKWALTSGGAGGQAVPTTADDVFFDNGAGTGNVTVTTAVSCKSVTCTGYSNTLTVNSSINIYGGNVVLSPTMTITTSSGTPSLVLLVGGGTITSNGKTWPFSLNIQSTWTLGDNWTISQGLTISNTTTLNGNTLNIGTSLTSSGVVSGTTNIVLNGTGTWSGTFNVANPLNINTSGTITISGTVRATNFSHITGTVITTGSTLDNNGQSATWNISGISLNNVSLSGTSTITLSSDLNVLGNLTFNSGLVCTINGPGILYVGGNITQPTNNSIIGTSTIYFNGSGNQIWTNAAGSSAKINVTVNTTGTFTFPSTPNLTYNTGTLTILSSQDKVDAYNCTITIAATATTTFDTNGIKFKGLVVGGSSTVNTIQLNSPFYISNGVAALGASSQNMTINGSALYIENGILQNGISGSGGAADLLGTSQIIMIGDKASMTDVTLPSLPSAGTRYALPLTINIRGTLQIFGKIRLGAGANFSVTAGKVVNYASATNLPSLIISSSISLTNIHLFKFATVSFTGSPTITVNQYFSGNPQYKTAISGAHTVTFTDTVPKLASFINVKNCTVSNRNQLRVIGRNANGGSNSGVLFGETGLNGFPLRKYGKQISYGWQDEFQKGGMDN